MIGTGNQARAAPERGEETEAMTAFAARPLPRARRMAASAALFAGLTLAILAPTDAKAQGAVRQTFGEWQMRCETPPGARSEQCALVQNIVAEDRPNIRLLVIVLKTADGKSRIMRVVTPLGILLPGRLGLKVDQTDVGRTEFVRCITTGCVAEVVIDDALVAQLQKGRTATFIVFETPEEGIGIPVSLTGFAKGFESLP